MSRLLLLLLVACCYAKPFPSYQEIVAEMDRTVAQFQQEGIPQITARRVAMGNSTQLREMYAFCFGNCDRGPFSYLLLGGIHGREGLSVVTCLLAVSRLFTLLHERNEWVLRILSDTMVWVIPSLNPDTYAFNLAAATASTRLGGSPRYGMQRKSMKETCPASMVKRCYRTMGMNSSSRMESGVDLNRNFPVCFDVDELGSSGLPCSDIYRGPSPLSEVENQAFIHFLHSLERPPTFAISLHAFGRSILHPFSCKSLASSLNASSLQSFQQATKHLLHNISATYTTGQAWNTPGLYTVNGDIVDYLWAKEGIPAVNIELPPTYPQASNYVGFWPDVWHEEECLQLVLNGLELARCNLIGTKEGIRNEGFGVCRGIEVREGGKSVTRSLNPFERLPLPSQKSEVRWGEKKGLFFWNATRGAFEEGRLQEDRLYLRFVEVETRDTTGVYRVVLGQVVVTVTLFAVLVFFSFR